MHQNNLKTQLSEKQRLYRDIFLRAKDALVSKLQTFPNKEARLDFLNNVVSKDVLRKLRAIQKAQETYECCRCGTCCKMASSEFSYRELIYNAASGDVFAKSFTSVFVPYKDGEAQNESGGAPPLGEFDSYLELLKEREMLGETNFYYCPKLEGKAGCYACGDYENRPSVCRDFPNNPLVILPPKCSFNAWRDEFEVEALFLNAMIEITGYFVEQLNKPDDNDKMGVSRV